MTDTERVQLVVNQIVREAEGINLLLCKAGTFRFALIMEQELSDIKGVFDTYVFDALLCARAVAPVMVRQRYLTGQGSWL